jgi:hypothetical protein
MSKLLRECVLGCKKIDNSYVLAKNRDRTYDAEVAIIHHVDSNLEFAIIYDLQTNYVEGINASSGIAIMNVALQNGTDFSSAPSDEGRYIFKVLINAKDPVEAAKQLCKKDTAVYGSTFIVGTDQMLVLENAKDKKPKCFRKKLRKRPVVRTNHSEYLPGAGFDPSDGDDYISSKVRQSVGEVLFSSAESAEELLDSLNYSLFGNHSAYDTTRETKGMRTCSQMAIDVSNMKVYFRNIPGHGKLSGVFRTGDKSIKPKIDIKILDYNEPVDVPFETWSSGVGKISENFELARYLNPEDSYDDDSFLSDIEKSAMRERDIDSNIKHYIDRENEIIRIMFSLQNLLNTSDASMMHLTKNRDVEEDKKYVQKFLDDAEASALEMYDLQSALRSKEK